MTYDRFLPPLYTNRHDIAKILLKVALNNNNPYDIVHMESTTQNIGLTLYYDRKYQNYGSVQIDNLKLFSTKYRVRDIVFNASFNDILVVSRWSGLL